MISDQVLRLEAVQASVATCVDGESTGDLLERINAVYKFLAGGEVQAALLVYDATGTGH